MFMMVFYKEKIGLQKDEEENLVMLFDLSLLLLLEKLPYPIVDFERLLTP